MKFTSSSLADTENKAQEFIAHITKKPHSRAVVVGLSGDLGSGKTTFVQAAARALGVSDTVTSPTFVIEKIYKLSNESFDHLIHIDAYRLEKSEELKTLGWHDIVSNPKNLIMIEWPERVQDIMPKDIEILGFVFIDEHVREITS